MKKTLLFAAIAVTVAAACSKTVSVPQEPADKGDAVPVLLSVSSPRSIEVKSTGAATQSWAGQTLNIYSYEAGVADYSAATAFIDNVEATAPSTGLADGITLTNPATREPFYYAAGKYYDFFGYYIDDAAAGIPSVLADGVYVPFTIDGSQDLMVATSDKAADIEAAGKTGQVAEDRVYSAYAARRGIQPKLVFKHQLARFTFEIVAGVESGNNVNVDGISIESVASGELKVVGAERGLKNLASDKVVLNLQEKSGNGTMQALTPVKPNAFDGTKSNVKSIGESLMVVPGEASYKLTVYTSQDGTTTPIAPLEQILNIANITGAPEGAVAFEAGYTYKVTIVVYGLEEVKISVELEEWKDGGSTIIDPDL